MTPPVMQGAGCRQGAQGTDCRHSTDDESKFREFKQPAEKLETTVEGLFSLEEKDYD